MQDQPQPKKTGRLNADQLTVLQAIERQWNDFAGPARQPAPTQSRAASAEKFAELQRRAQSKQDLFHPRDGGVDLH